MELKELSNSHRCICSFNIKNQKRLTTAKWIATPTPERAAYRKSSGPSVRPLVHVRRPSARPPVRPSAPHTNSHAQPAPPQSPLLSSFPGSGRANERASELGSLSRGAGEGTSR